MLQKDKREALSLRILTAFQEAAQQGKLIRNLSNRKVARVEVDSVSYFVKAYHRSFWDFLSIPSKRMLKNMELLSGLTPPCVLEENDRGWRYCVTQDTCAPDLFYAFERGVSQESLERYFSSAGRLLAEIHRRGIFHADCKPPNFVINRTLEGYPDVLIIDCDRLKVYPRGIPREKRLYNLAQFIAANRPMKTIASLLLAFFKAYCDASSLKNEEASSFLQEALERIQREPKIEKWLPEQERILLWKNWNEPSRL